MDTKKITHIVVDEKFIMSAYKQFEEVQPEQNKFCVLVEDTKNELNHIKLKKGIVRLTKKQLLVEAKKLNENNIVIFHSLDSRFYDVLFALDKKVKTVLFCFGFEIYGDAHFFPRKKIYGKKTKLIVNISNINAKKKLKEFLIPYYRKIKSQIPLTRLETKKNALKRIDYMGSSFREEFLNIQRLIGQKKIFFHFWYYCLEDIVDINEPVVKNRNNVLIGNSANSTNNHLDCFDFLNKLDVQGYSKIMVPLSYGDPNYGEIVINKGKSFYGESFIPLVKFMEYEQYVRILKHCSLAIIYAKRQQAIGNILVLLWYGATVFLSKKNTFYSFLKRIGIHVFCIESYKFNHPFALLNEKEISHNRKTLIENFSSRKLQNELNQSIEGIL